MPPAQPSSDRSPDTVPADIAALSFEAALDELEQIVRTLEAGNSQLDQAIDLYQRGADLKKHCEAHLRLAQQKIDRIVLGDGGGDAPTATRPLDPDQ